MSARTLPEWIGATPDRDIPKRVRLRVWDASGHCCALCGRSLRPGDKWDLDHKLALVNGGEHREGNMQVACSWCHPAKTAQDVVLKARSAAIRKRHAGIRKRSTLPGSRDSNIKIKLDRTVTDRRTGEPWERHSR